MKNLLLLAAVLPFVAVACATPEPTAEPTAMSLPTAVEALPSTPEPPEPAVEGIPYDSPAGWSLTLPMSWEGKYDVIDLTEDLALYGSPTAGTQFVFVPTDTASSPQALLTLLSFDPDAWAEANAAEGAPVGAQVAECDGMVVVASTPQSNPYEQGSDDAAAFDDAFAALDLGTLTCGPSATSGGDLVGTLWLWRETLMSDDTTYTPEEPMFYSVAFADDGTMNLVADCNNAAGTYVADEQELTIELGPVTLAECGPGSLYQEFLMGIGEVASYMMEDGDLVLMLELDSGIMRFSSTP